MGLSRSGFSNDYGTPTLVIFILMDFSDRNFKLLKFLLINLLLVRMILKGRINPTTGKWIGQRFER